MCSCLSLHYLFEAAAHGPEVGNLVGKLVLLVGQLLKIANAGELESKLAASPPRRSPRRFGRQHPELVGGFRIVLRSARFRPSASRS
jgi:hypothetical protein